MNESTTNDDAAEFEYYLPGMPSLSAGPSRVEQFLKQLFRQRGEYRLVARRVR